MAAGHLWVFSNEIRSIDGTPQAGDVVTVLTSTGKPLGAGFYNPHSLIAVRMLGPADTELAFDFFKVRLERAATLRKKLYPDQAACRIVHGESDSLPGLIVDRYDGTVVVQTFSAGMDRRMTLLCDAIESVLKPDCIVERNESPLRALEGLESRTGVVRGNAGRVERVQQVQQVQIEEYGIRYEIDPLTGQKTGFFLDQRENRNAIRRYAKDAVVLDCFTYSGGFALNAAKGGARRVTAVDVSEGACELARRNTGLNGTSGRINVVTADCPSYLDELLKESERFDLINLDPPSFTKNRKTVQQAKAGYKRINTAAMRLLREGGVLTTSSCSHHLREETFLEILAESARMAGRRMSILEQRGASPDHPVHPAMPETKYLKFFALSLE